ncbi:MAG: hypothetical protein K2W97_08665 [Chthoniobacterales bacterium]|nr:hypothetical protein [Chthoniobacterales bacterium]
MNIKDISLHILLFSILLTSYSFAQSSTAYSSIPSSSSSQESTPLPKELNVDLSLTKNYSIKVKVGEELAINVKNLDNLYHSGELDNIDLFNHADLQHTLCTSFYSDSWNPFNHIFSLEKENNLNQEIGDPLVYHFKAVRSGNTYIYFCTLYEKSSKFGPLLMPEWIGSKITVEVSE